MDRPLRTIVVGFDFSRQSRAALAHACATAARAGAAITLVHADSAAEDFGELPVAALGGAGDLEGPLPPCASEARERLRALAGQIAQRGIPASYAIVGGRPGAALCAAAREQGADLVVVGTHGRVRRLVPGSVARALARACPADVLVVRGGGEGSYRRLLVPTDFSEDSEHALALAAGLASSGATIELLHCWHEGTRLSEYPRAGSSDGMLIPVREAKLSIARELGEKLLAKHAPRDAHVRFRFAEGEPTEEIAARLDRGDHDLVVVGPHGRSRLRRALLGSVAMATLRRAPCPVAVARRREPGDPMAAYRRSA